MLIRLNTIGLILARNHMNVIPVLSHLSRVLPSYSPVIFLWSKATKMFSDAHVCKIAIVWSKANCGG